MEPIHIFHKGLSADESSIFTADIAEKNEKENVECKKSQEYAVTGLSIIQDIGSELVTVTDVHKLNILSNSIQNLVKEKKEPDLNLKISNPETKDIIIPFQKKSTTNCPPIKLTFYNTTIKKNEEIEIYSYFNHLQKFSFVWEYLLLDSKYSIELPKDQKKLIRKMAMSKIATKKLFVCESRIWNLEEPPAGAASTMSSTNIRLILFGYMWTDIHIENILNISGNSKNLDTV